jgi:hypothetical protein
LVNFIRQPPPEVFKQLLQAIRSTANTDAKVVAAMMVAVEDMQQAYGDTSFLSRYQAFMSLLADHLQVFGPVVAPFLPALAQLLPSS